MHRVYVEGEYKVGDRKVIEDSEAHHVLKVLRLKEQDEVELFNGQGQRGRAEIVETSKKDFSVEIVSENKFPQVHHGCLAFALPKGQALDFIVHRCTELGVGEFQPLLTGNSLHPSSWNEERWQKVLIEVSKQCQSAYLPRFHEPKKISDWLRERDTSRILFFCDEEQREKKEAFLSGIKFDVLIGAEGGWSPSEREEILKKGAETLSLGANRLRAETAALVGMTLAKKLLGEL